MKRSDFKMGLGASSILMIVIVLVLTTFGVLSLASAQADSKLTEKVKTMTTEYYCAENKVEELYSQIDSVLASGLGKKYRDASLKCLNETLMVGADDIIEFSVPINENQQIKVQLQIRIESDSRFYVVSQKLVTTGTWDPEININTWEKE